MILFLTAYLAAGLLVGGLMVRELLPKPRNGKPARKIEDRDRVLVGLVGLACALCWPLIAVLAAGAWTLWALGIVFELVLERLP